MLFLLFFSSLVSSVLMILCLNPINAVLFLIATFLSVAMIFLSVNAEFLALMFIIIYVGAIAVLFLFIVMMINIKRIEKDNTTYLTIGTMILFVLFAQFFVVFSNPSFHVTYFLENNFNFLFSELNFIDESLRIVLIQRLGVMFFYTRPFLLILTAFVLLVAMIGSIWLTNTKTGFSMKKQLSQLSRTNHIQIIKIY